MLFDLRHGKRRRVIQVVYGVLAVLFAVSFVGFGIGSDAAGGIFDALGLGGGSSGTSDPQFEEQIEQAEQEVAANPKSERALLDLASAHFAAAQVEVEQDEATGTPVVTEEAEVEFDEAISAWERYLELKPKRPDTGVAGQIITAYTLLNDAEGAAEAQRLLAEEDPTAKNYGDLALYLYFGGDIKGGDEAAEKAIAEAPKAERKTIEKQLDSLRAQALKAKEAAEKSAPQGGAAFGEPQLTTPGSPAPVAP